MASSTVPVGVDMNNPSNLYLYSQILVFKTDISREDITFESSPPSEQRSLQAIAHQLGLDYEYSKVSRTVRISRCEPSDPSDSVNPDSRRTGNIQPFATSRIPSHMDLTSDNNCHQNVAALDSHHTSFSMHSSMMSPSPIPSTIFDSAFSVDLYSSNPNTTYSCPTSPVSSLGQVDEEPPFLELSPEPPEPTASIKRKHSEGGTSSRSYIPKRPWNVWRLGSRKTANADPSNNDGVPKDGIVYACRSCQQSFSREEDLKVHERSHAKQKPFQCPDCNRAYTRREPMLRHQQRIHSVPLYPPVAMSVRKDQKRGSSPGVRHRTRLSSIPGAGPFSPSALSSPAEEIDLTSEMLSTPQPFYYNQTASKPSSTYSRHSECGASKQESIFSKRSSTLSQGASGYQEIVFDSNSVYSGSSTGRRGPLSDWARVGANAVKKVGACWRCKFLRKTCDPDDPCALCPRSDRSKWEAVGCRRGAFEAEMPLNAMCKQSPCPQPAEEERRAISALASVSQEATTRRDLWVRQELASDANMQFVVQRTHADNIRQLLAQTFSSVYTSAVKKPNLGALDPVKECVMAICWELLGCSYSQPIVDSVGGFHDLIRLLAAAAVYQAGLEDNQLIAQSLICLRTCLEAMRKKSSGIITQYSHSYCSPLSRDCKVEYIATINMHIQGYFNELSRVIFKKENIRKKNLCYLSIFYSFCIQSIVRKCLIMLAADSHPASLRSKQYMHIPLRLFIASSGTYDPLARDLLSFSDQHDDYEQARQAVGHGDWCLSGIRDSGSYLKRLFEDDGDPIHTVQYDMEMVLCEQLEVDNAMDLSGSVDYLSAFWETDCAGTWDERIFGSP